MNLTFFTQIGRFSKLQLRNFFVLLVLLLAMRMALPFIVKWYVNKTLGEIPEYYGHVRDVDIHLWRGAYTIKDIAIVKTTGKVPVPFFSAPKVDLSIEWKAILEGACVGKMILYFPVVNFVNGPTHATSQVGVDKPWFDIIKKLFPLNINRCEVYHGSIHYRDFYSSPKVDLKLDQIHMIAMNLTNSEKLAKSLVATVKMDGRVFDESNFFMNAKVNPWKEKATFDLDFKLRPVSLIKLNDFTRAYGKFDFETGTLAITSELTANNGELVGYIKPLLDHVAVVSLKEDINNPLKLAWESVVGGFLRLFRNLPKDRFATKIPIHGTFSGPRADILPTLGNILRNEFIRVYTGQFENNIQLENIE